MSARICETEKGCYAGFTLICRPGSPLSATASIHPPFLRLLSGPCMLSRSSKWASAVEPHDDDEGPAAAEEGGGGD